VGFLHAGELLVQAAVQVRQLLVLQAHEMQDRRVQVSDVVAVRRRRWATC